MEKKKLLLHCCCGPCSTSVLEKIIDLYNITLFYYNPNTMPESEYLKRLEELKKYNKMSGNNLIIIEAEYDRVNFINKVSGLEKLPEGGSRCDICYDMRLRKTAKYAKENNFDLFCTTLSVSPYKNSSKINEIGLNLEKEFGIKFLVADFKQQDGYKKSIELSKKFDLYRQNYCGCRF